MKNLKEYFLKIISRKEPEDIMRIANIISPLLDGVVNDIFMSYRMELLSEPITYIVPAIWGAKKEGELTPVQKEINARAVPIINKVFALLQIKKIDPDQEFALYFLIRGIIIAKITFMIEALRGRLSERSMDEQSLKEALMRFKPHGSA
ncbi:MAG TPA: hypothetical protein VEF33_08030 [Syntrophales bacterium]|nr:hypothetical protein [Syntrophales bacterium]